MKNQNGSKLASFFGINRAARAGAIAGALTLLVLIVAIVVNVLVGMIPTSIAKFNVTGAQTFRISGKTVDWLKGLDEDVTLYLTCKGGRSNADGDIYNFLCRYAEESDRVTLEVIDSSANSTFINSYGGEWPSNLSVIVESDSRYKIIDNTSLYYYYNSLLESSMTPEEYEEMLSSLSSSDSTGTYVSQFMESTTAYFDGESRVTNAINFVTLDSVPVAYTLTGNGSSTLDSSLESLLSQSSYDMRTTLSLASIPEDCDILIINAPSVDLTENEAAVLTDYLAAGGNLLLTTFYNADSMPNLAGVLEAYGLGFEDEKNILCEGNPNYYFSDSSSAYPYLFNLHINSEHAATGDFDGEAVAYFPHSIKISEVENVTVTSWLYTSAAGYLLDTNNSQLGEKGTYNVGVIAESGETKIFWLASPYILAQSVNAYASGGNFGLAVSAMNWMSGIENDAITIESKAIDTASLGVTVTQFAIWGVVLVILIPIATAVTGIVVWYHRKKR